MTPLSDHHSCFVKIQNVLSFCCQLTHFAMEKEPLNEYFTQHTFVWLILVVTYVQWSLHFVQGVANAKCLLVMALCVSSVWPPPVDSIWAVMLLWRLTAKEIRTAMLCTTVVHSDTHTNVSSSYRSPDWSLWRWPVSLFIDLCLSVCICFLLHICCSIVSTVGWTWWDWSLILRA